MFRLEKLEINGFKSFADRTTLVFGEGITAVVGPNGCGKSNVAEAISWVLGEQSAKNLRGGKMEDIIFNGTRDRKPTGMSEVLLTMLATADIAARESEHEDDGEQEFDEALSRAQQASDAARSLVEELTPADQPDQSASITATHPTASLDIQSHAEPALGPPVEIAGNDSPEASAQASPDAETELAAKKTAAKRRSPRPPKRRKIAVAAGERIVVGRRLYRTGDSEYLLNGRACLLRDIQDLFAGTGLGGAHYAIIEQGRIGQILSSKPLDRRGLIEEAAGITKFKSRKRAAELKLESAKQNLTRLNDIISEVERQVNSLKRQAQKARRYRRLRDEMRSLLKVVFTADYHRLSASLERIENELRQSETEQRAIEAKLAHCEQQHRAASTESRVAEDALAALREQYSAVELESDRARNRRAFDGRQLEELAARVGELDRDQNQLESRLAFIDESTQQRATAVRQLEMELNAAQADLLQRETDYHDQVIRVREAEQHLDNLRQQMLRQVGETEGLKNLSSHLQDSIRRTEQRQTALKAEFDRAGAQLAEASAQHQNITAEVARGESNLSRLDDEIISHADRLNLARAEAADLRTQYDAANAERNAAEHRLRSLRDLDAHRAYYSDAVQQVLSPEHAARVNALGTLADFVDVEPQYERLVESLFSRELQCVLVPTIDDALAGVEYIKSEALGRGAFLVVGLHGAEGDETASDKLDAKQNNSTRAEDSNPVTIERQLNPNDPAVPQFMFEPARLESWPSISASTEGPPGFQLEVLRAIDLLGLRPEIKAVVERAVPDRCGAAVVPDIEAALQLSIENPSRIYVTMDGEQVLNGRLIVTGARAGEQGTSLLGLKREIRDLGGRVAAVNEAVNELQSKCDAYATTLAALEAEAVILDGRRREQERDLSTWRSRLENAAHEIERANQHVAVVEADIARAGNERADFEAQLSRVTLELANAEQTRATLQWALDESQAALAEMRARSESMSEQLSSARSMAATLTERLSAARSELRRLETEAEELRSRVNRNRLELYESHGKIEQLKASLAEADTTMARLGAELEELGREIATAAEGMAQARARSDELQIQLGQLRHEVSATRDRRSQIEIESARTQSEAEHLKKDCLSDLGMTIEDVVTSVELATISGQAESAGLSQDTGDDHEAAGEAESGREDIDSIRTRLEQLRSKLDEIGPVNMMALEELEESEQRFQFLSAQRADILDSIRMTEQALAEIRRRSRERFRHAFAHINENFQRMFVELFGGGRGEMILIDEDDILESGIDLIAQPPGKRLQNVLLLSGGEKAMAAIALVLAIFQYRPSPFCILDEVDAPLDEVNVGRFSDKVIEMSQETQFLVITHNKRTMEAARALYGVTMEEPGVSKLVSVKFE